MGKNVDRHLVERELVARHGNTGYVSVKRVRVEREDRDRVFLSIERGWIDTVGEKHMRNFCTVPYSEETVQDLIGLLNQIMG